MGEKMLRMAPLLESREIEEEDKEVLRNTRLTSGARVLLYLRDQFTESSLKEFLDCLKLSLTEFRMFEEEQMILKMPIFQEEIRESVDDVEELDRIDARRLNNNNNNNINNNNNNN